VHPPLVLLHETAAELHSERRPVLAFPRRHGAREHLSTVAAFPVLLVAACPSTDPAVLSKEPAAEDTPKGHAGHKLLDSLG